MISIGYPARMFIVEISVGLIFVYFQSLLNIYHLFKDIFLIRAVITVGHAWQTDCDICMLNGSVANGQLGPSIRATIVISSFVCPFVCLFEGFYIGVIKWVNR